MAKPQTKTHTSKSKPITPPATLSAKTSDSEPLAFATTMTHEDLTARQIYQRVKSNPARARFGFGDKLAVVNVDFQQAYTRPDLFPVSAYVTDPEQIAHVNLISARARSLAMPVIWTRVCYKPDGGDAGVWGTRTNTPDSLQNIKHGSPRHAFDPRCEIDFEADLIFDKRMPSAFFETPLKSYLTFHKVDTVLITGGSTSGCIRATAVDSLSHGYRTIIAEECVADKHESYHFANLTDLQLKYADVVNAADVIGWLDQHLARFQSTSSREALRPSAQNQELRPLSDEKPGSTFSESGLAASMTAAAIKPSKKKGG
jgi:nicotinamidase-related amidase